MSYSQSSLSFGAWKRLLDYVLICAFQRFSVWSMKRRHLADVLLKILGLFLCLVNIPSFFVGIVFFFIPFFWGSTSTLFAYISIYSYAVSDGIKAGLGIYLIVRSRKIAEFWFKNEDE